MRGAPIFLSGRCFFGRRKTPSGPLFYTSSDSNISSNNTPLSFIGNSYYERRFGNKLSSSSSSSLSSSRGECNASNNCNAFTKLPPLQIGDIVVKMGSATPTSLRSRRVVDVTGIQTSFLNASERNPKARFCVDDVVNSMHMHDGHEIPELQRGVVSIGRLTVLCAFPLHNVISLILLDNVTGTLLKRRSLNYRSEEESLQMMRVIAEGCRTAVTQGLQLQPIIRDNNIVAVHLQ